MGTKRAALFVLGSGVCDVRSLRFTSGATPIDLLTASMVAGGCTPYMCFIRGRMPDSHGTVLILEEFSPLRPFTATVRPAKDSPRTSPSRVASYTSPNSPSPSLSGSSVILKYQQVQRINVGHFIPRPNPKNFCCPPAKFLPPSRLQKYFSATHPITTNHKRSGVVTFLHFNQKKL